MSIHLKCIIVLLFMVTVAAAQMANAQSISVELAEKTPPVDPGDPTMTLPEPPPTTTITTTTTTTLPTIPRCPVRLAHAKKGSDSGYNYWAFDDETLCDDYDEDRTLKLFCFENSYVDQARSDRVDWEDYNPGWCLINLSVGDSATIITGTAAEHPETCYICGCIRIQGCFAPGVKITMADGSLRKIEDVRFFRFKVRGLGFLSVLSEPVLLLA